VILLGLLAGAGSPDEAYAQSESVWNGWTDYGLGRENSRPRSGSGTSSFFDFGQSEAFPAIMDGGPRPYIEPQPPEIVEMPVAVEPGTIIIDTEGRRLYYVLRSDAAYMYPISVGREGFTWTGTETIRAITYWPDWHPPEEMRVRDPRLPEKMYGGIRNPLGAVALFLGNSLYRIHGTNDPKTIGLAASSGCFRMLNEHALHLATLAPVGTVVKVVPRLEMPEPVADLPWLKKPAALGALRTRAQY
jgi:lipoprotein-anchoring transpeptidase ErfK/SrfK